MKFPPLGLLGLLGALGLASCSSSSTSSSFVKPDVNYAYLLERDTLKKNLYILASEAYEGRRTGEKGQKMAADFIANHYKKLGIAYPKGASSYFQAVPDWFMNGGFGPKLKDSENVWAYIEGSEKPEEVLVISAHYDHMGYMNGKLYPGADDNGSGTVAVMEIARLFQQAVNHGLRPKRSILFLHLTGEEFGLHGSRYYVEHPVFPLENTIANLNIDMIGRRSYEYKGTDDYVFLVGSDRLSTDLHLISEAANENSVKLKLDYTFNAENEPQQIYYRSDHYNFAKNNIPAIFYYNGAHLDYHQPTDTADKIDYDLLLKRSQLIFTTAWSLSNVDERPQVNKAQ